MLNTEIYKFFKKYLSNKFLFQFLLILIIILSEEDIFNLKKQPLCKIFNISKIKQSLYLKKVNNR